MRLAFLTLFISIGSIISTCMAGTQGKDPLPKTGPEETGFVQFGRTMYSERFGWAPFNTIEDGLKEIVVEPLNLGANERELPDETATELTDKAAQNGGTLLLNYSKMDINHQLYVPPGKTAVLFRVRDKFQYFNEPSSSAAEFTYLKEDGEDSEWSLKGALMADFYLPGLYSGRESRQYRLALRLGIETDMNTAPGEDETDLQRYYAVGTFLANPNLNARFLGIPGAHITSPQFLQIGAVHEVNNVSGKDDTKWILGWQPRFSLDNGFSKYRFLAGFMTNARMYYKKTGTGEEDKISFATLYKKTKPLEDKGVKDATILNTAEKSRYYSMINPSINLEGASDAIASLEKTKDEYEKLRDESLRYEIKTVLGRDIGDHANVELSYTFRARQAFSDLDSHGYSHEVKLEAGWHPAGMTETGISAFISWEKGAIEPDFQDVDRIKAGVSMRF